MKNQPPPTSAVPCPQPEDRGRRNVPLAESIRRLEVTLEAPKGTVLALQVLACYRAGSAPERCEAALEELVSLRGAFEKAPYRMHIRLIDEFAYHVVSTNGGLQVPVAKIAARVPIGVAVRQFADELLNRIDSPMRTTMTGEDPSDPDGGSPRARGIRSE